MDFEELYRRVENCNKCPLRQTRKNAVIERGSRTAKLMFVGEAPGGTEDETGIPFVGAAGKLLDEYLAAAGIDREEVYICNVLKCRPPQNRDPQPAEEDACMDYLRAQVRLVDPQMIVCLGRISAMRLIKPDFKITAEHGKWFQKGEYLMTAVYHPAALLRDHRKKEDMMEDMKEIKRKLDEGSDWT